MALPVSRRKFVGQTSVAVLGMAASRLQVSAQQPAPQPPVEIQDDKTVLDIRCHSRPLAVYNYNTSHAGLYRPFFHPLCDPSGQTLTQNGEFPGTLRGHYWHRALFVAHQRVNEVSFWEERQADCGRMAHLQFDKMTSGATGCIVERLAWRDLAAQDLLHETRIIQLPNAEPAPRVIDLTIQLQAVRETVTFAKTPYNLLACRVANSLCRLPEKQQYTRKYGALVNFAPLSEGGQITNSEHQKDEACRGARAKWCDFSGPLLSGTWGGISILDHPSNPRHPTPWHNWNNMTFTASFTYHEPFTLKKGESLRLAYRILLHAGDAKLIADVEQAWQEYARIQPTYK